MKTDVLEAFFEDSLRSATSSKKKYYHIFSEVNAFGQTKAFIIFCLHVL